MAGIKINQYPLERLTFGDEDYYDIDYWTGSSYETAKIKGSVIKSGIASGLVTLYANDGTLAGDRAVSGAGTNSLAFGNNVLNENLSFFKVNSTQGLEQFASAFPITNAGLEVIKNPANFISTVKSSATDYSQFRLQNAEFIVNSFLGTNNYMHSSTPALSSTIISDGGAGTNSRLLLYGSGRVDLGTTGSVGAYITLDTSNTFTDRNTAPKGLEYTLDYSANYSNRSLVDKEYVDNNAGGDSIYTASGTIPSSVVATITDSLTLGHLNIDQSIFGTYSVIGTTTKNSSTGYNIAIHEPTGQMTFNVPSGTNMHFDVANSIKGKLLSNGSWVFGGVSLIGSEKISLQGSTAVQGAGTSTGSALSIYDNDTTPNKLWDFLDNGNVELGSDSTVDLDNNILTFDVGTFSGVGVDKGLIIDGSDYQITNTNSTNSFLEVFNENGSVFNAMQRGGILSYSDVNPLAFLLSRDSTKGLKLDTNNSRISTNELIFNNSFSGNQGIYLRGSGVTNDLFFRDSLNQIQHRIRQGDSGATASFFYSGMSGKGFIVGGSSAISGEDISLQADTLINGSLDMNNNRITNTIVNPSVQETTSTATFTINADEETTGVLTAMASATTIASPTGTPVQGQSLIIRLKDDGTARAITWNAIFRGIGITLPTTTTANKLLYIGCMYNSTDTKWDIIALKEEA